MGNVAVEALEILEPFLPPALVGAKQVALLRAAGQSLVPITDLRIGLECRLGAGADQVDLQQGIYGDGLEETKLARHAAGLASSTAGPAGPVWRRLAEFAGAWSDRSSRLHDVIHQVWLEFDVPGATPAPGIPSLFLSPRERAAGVSLEAVRLALETLRGSALPPEVARGITRCFEACAGDGSISHVGLMLSRPVDQLRVNIKRLRAERIVPFLDRIGWPGQRDRLAALVPRLYSYAQAITVCVDIGAEVDPRLGLECYVMGLPGLQGRSWPVFLDDLIGQGVCTAEKRDALIAWPGHIDPGSARCPWPGVFVAESLRRAPDRFGVLARKLNHVKLTVESSGMLAAKAYIGLVHSWLEPAADDRQVLVSVEPKKRRAAYSAQAAGVVRLDAAIDAATDFLLDARTQGGWWIDFPNVCGGSDEWITAYTGAALAGLPARRAREAAGHAWLLLCERRRDSGGWAWNLLTPEDWDSTAWGVRFAARLGAARTERAQQARRCLEVHVLPDGGLASYREKTSHLDPGPGLHPSEGSTAGWCRTPHACVTAAAADIGDVRMLGFLRRRQGSDGNWTGYWWLEDGYTTALAAEALSRTGDMADRARVRAAARWASDRLGADGSAWTAQGPGLAFSTAWCVRTLALIDHEADTASPICRAVDWLVDHQREDGSWPASGVMVGATRDVTDPRSSLTDLQTYLDEAAIFTTATVVSALSAARSRLWPAEH